MEIEFVDYKPSEVEVWRCPEEPRWMTDEIREELRRIADGFDPEAAMREMIESGTPRYLPGYERIYPPETEESKTEDE